MADVTPLMRKPLRFLRLPEVMYRVGIKHTRIHKLESEGRFPKRIKISDRASAWLESEIEEWMEQRLAGRAAASHSNARVAEPDHPVLKSVKRFARGGMT